MREVGLAAALYAAVLAGLAPAMARAMPGMIPICTADGAGSALNDEDGAGAPIAAGHCPGLAVAAGCAAAFPFVMRVRPLVMPRQRAKRAGVRPRVIVRPARGPPSGVGVVIGDDAPGCAFQIVVLVRLHRPEKGRQRGKPQHKRGGNEYDERVHRGVLFKSLRAFSTTTSDEPLMAMAEMSGVTRLAAAKGIAKTL